MRLRLARWLTKLYPSAWRERYGEEFDALVEDSRPGWRGLADIAGGALAMQLKNGLSLKWTVLVCSLAGLALALPAILMIPKIFLSTAALSIKSPASPAMADAVSHAAERVLRRDNLIALIDRRQLYAAERAVMPIEDLLGKLHSDISIGGLGPRSEGAQSVFRVGFNYPDPVKARLVTQDLTTMLIDEYARQNQGVAVLEILDMASLPGQHKSPNRPAIVLAGFLAGALFGALLSLTSRAVRQWRTGLDIRSTALACAFAGLFLAAPLSLLIPDRFLSLAAIKVPANSPATATAAAVSKAVTTTLRRENLVALAERTKTAPGTATKEQLLHELEKNISVSGVGRVAFRVGFQSGDRRQAQLVTREVMTMVIDEYLRQNPGMPGLEILDLPSSPESPVFPNRPVIAFMGLLAGAGLGLLVALVKLFLRSSRTGGSGLQPTVPV